MALLPVPALIIAAVVSCTPTVGPTAFLRGDVATYGDLESLDPNGQVVVYWYEHSQRREEVLLGMIDAFNATNQWGITVVGEHVGSTDVIFERIRARIGSRALPEIAIADAHQVAVYAAQAASVELGPYVESEKWGFTEQELNDFFPFVPPGDDLPGLEGRYGFPLNRSMEVIYYNEDWLRDLGYDRPPRTFAEFKEMACAATDPDAGTYGYELSVDTSTFADMLFNQGGAMLAEDASGYAFGDEHGLAVLSFLKELFDEGCAILETKQYGDQADFGAGKVLFTISSTSGLPYYRSAVAEGAGFNWSISPMVTTLDIPKVNVYGASLSIMRTTPEKQLAAWLFIKWFTEPEQQARWVRASNAFPLRQSAAEGLTEYFVENPQYQKAFGFLGYELAVEPGVAGYDECGDSIGDMMSAVAAGEDPQTELANAVEECNALLEEAAPQ